MAIPRLSAGSMVPQGSAETALSLQTFTHGRIANDDESYQYMV